MAGWMERGAESARKRDCSQGTARPLSSGCEVPPGADCQRGMGGRGTDDDDTHERHMDTNRLTRHTVAPVPSSVQILLCSLAPSVVLHYHYYLANSISHRLGAVRAHRGRAERFFKEMTRLLLRLSREPGNERKEFKTEQCKSSARKGRDPFHYL